MNVVHRNGSPSETVGIDRRNMHIAVTGPPCAAWIEKAGESPRVFRTPCPRLAMRPVRAPFTVVLAAGNVPVTYVDQMQNAAAVPTETSTYCGFEQFAEWAAPQRAVVQCPSTLALPESSFTQRMYQKLPGGIRGKVNPAVQVEEEVVLDALCDEYVDRFAVRVAPFT